MWSYPVTAAPDEDTILITFPDFSEAVTYGNDLADALRHAVDALKVAMAVRIEENEDIPLPSKPRRGQPTVALPPLVGTKAAIYMEMRRQRITKAELARRLGQDPKQVDRLLDVLHASRHDQIDKALAALGKRLEIVIRDAA